VKSTKSAQLYPVHRETGDRYGNKQAREFLGTLRLGPFVQADGRGGMIVRIPAGPEDIVLRDIIRALVHMQIYMLADIIVAIPAADLAVESVV
jgi:hypothetical protein